MTDQFTISQSSAVGQNPLPTIQSSFSTVVSIAKLWYSLALLYSLVAVIVTAVLFALNTIASAQILPDFVLLRDFPGFGMVVMIASLIGLIFAVIFLGLQKGSFLAYQIGVILLPIITVLVASLNLFVLIPLDRPTSTDSPLRLSANLLFVFIYILSVITFFRLLQNKQAYKTQTNSFSRQALVIGISLILFLIVPSLGSMSYAYYRVVTTDYNYAQVAKTVSFHVYKPATIPGGRTYATKYLLGKEMAGKTNAVQVGFDYPLSEVVHQKTPSLIILKHVAVEEGFDLDQFAKTELKGEVIVESTSLSTISNTAARVVRKKGEKYTITMLTYITEDKVLISLTSPTALSKELIELAQTLE